MARTPFNPGTRYLLNQNVYLVRQALPGGKLLVENTSSGTSAQSSEKELYAAWSQGKLHFEVNSTITTHQADQMGVNETANTSLERRDGHGTRPL